MAIRGSLIDSEATVFSSDLQRARQTAEAIAAACSLPVEHLAGLRELNNGKAAGLTLDQARQMENSKSYPLEDWVPYPEAESWNQMVSRIEKCMNEIDRCCESTAIVVSHGNAGVAVVNWWLDLKGSCRKGISYAFNAASISELTVNDWEEKTIARLNDCCHLSAIDDG